ncbi:hypothetical protein [Paenibacillus alkalitolerans]|uniref:hypothetical protein n=1 Tax=Paenibacillus alkalitolerans TaxID=2799335 RepID=UPI0018F55172|nr:hypothetical protein [Paenibacillus alkalitolerans]
MPTNTETTSTVDSSSAAEQKQDDVLPEIIQLQYTPVQLTDVPIQQPQDDWSQLKSVPFGAFKGTPVVLDIYEEPGEDGSRSMLRGYIKVSDKSYLIPDELSSSVLEEKDGSLYVLERYFPVSGKQFYILGGVELFSNGPGRVGYLTYQEEHDKWSFFDVWGKPSFQDLDSNNEAEFIIEFPGLHLHFSDVVFFRFVPDVGLMSATAKPSEHADGRPMFADLGRGGKLIKIVQ